MVCEAGSIHYKKKWPPSAFNLLFFLKFLKLGLTEMTSASGRRPRVRAVYPSLAYGHIVAILGHYGLYGHGHWLYKLGQEDYPVKE